MNPANLSKKMKVGDSVYLVTDQLKTGAGIPAMICEMQDSTVKVAIEETNGTRVLQAKTWDVLPSSLFTHSVLNIVYQTYLEIERDCGSILNLKPDAVIRELTEHGLASQTARQCVDLLNEVDWCSAKLPLRQWLKRIRSLLWRALKRSFSSKLAMSDAICEDGVEMPKELAAVIEHLKKWRTANNLSQAQATKVLNAAGLPVTLDSIQNWEIGRRSPTPLAALALAEFLNRNPRIKTPPVRRKKRNE